MLKNNFMNVTMFKNIFFLLLLASFGLFYCVDKKTISVSKSKIYRDSGNSNQADTEKIHSILNVLINEVLNGNINSLPMHVNKQKGIYLDLKGLWSYQELMDEIKKNDSYFEIYFFDHSKLEKSKGSKNVKTIKELFEASGGVEYDLFFETPDSCEVKIKFIKNEAFARDLNNPYFIRVDGEWYIYRLF